MATPKAAPGQDLRQREAPRTPRSRCGAELRRLTGTASSSAAGRRPPTSSVEGGGDRRRLQLRLDAMAGFISEFCGPATGAPRRSPAAEHDDLSSSAGGRRRRIVGDGGAGLIPFRRPTSAKGRSTPRSSWASVMGPRRVRALGRACGRVPGGAGTAALWTPRRPVNAPSGQWFRTSRPVASRHQGARGSTTASSCTRGG